MPPGANGVFGIFSNVMQADRWVHASPGFVGFDLNDPARAGRAECFRAIEESAAYVSRGHLNIIEELAELDVAEVVLTGGAAKGTLWPQIIADTLALPVRIPGGQGVDGARRGDLRRSRRGALRRTRRRPPRRDRPLRAHGGAAT